jgi:hypothetical protein
MARYRGTVQGNRGEASRTGSTVSGLKVSANGWDLGVDVYLDADENGEDFAEVWLTAGSNATGGAKLVGRFWRHSHKLTEGWGGGA